MIHENSAVSFQDHKETGKAEAWRRRVFDVFYSKPDRTMSDRYVVEELAAPDVNLVRPEITRLIQDGILREGGKIKCSITGKTVRWCEWTGKPYFSRGNKKPPFFAHELVRKQAHGCFSVN